MHIYVVAPPGECLRVKADMVLFAGSTVLSISERVRGVREDALYKSTLPLAFTFTVGDGTFPVAAFHVWKCLPPRHIHVCTSTVV